MDNYQQQLPQENGQLFLTDGGLETTLIFEQGIDLPEFAAFGLVESSEGRQTLRDYYADYMAIARQVGCGFILESPTWRANPDWAEKLGYDGHGLRTVNRDAIGLMHAIRDEWAGGDMPVVVSGCIGPRGDGYVVGEQMSVEQARAYHSLQTEAFADSDADMVAAITMTYPEEAIGLTLAAQDVGLPVVISFTTETDGRLPDTTSLAEAIEQVDVATEAGPAYYMVNCAHPDHFSDALADGESWVQRIRGIRANASRRSHAELDEAEELDPGDPQELGQLYRGLRSRFPQFSILGGCCGTNHRHVSHICYACH